MKLLIIILSITLFSCSRQTVTSNVEITYINGEQDTIQISYYKDCLRLEQGCLWTGLNNKSCGVRMYRILNN